MSVGAEITRIRKRKGLTQKLLAERVGIKPNFLSEIEAGKKIASFHTVVRIANVLDCSLDELAGKEISDASSEMDVDKAVQYCKEDGLVRKSVIMMAFLDEPEKFKIFTYIQDRIELLTLRAEAGKNASHCADGELVAKTHTTHP